MSNKKTSSVNEQNLKYLTFLNFNQSLTLINFNKNPSNHQSVNQLAEISIIFSDELLHADLLQFSVSQCF